MAVTLSTPFRYGNLAFNQRVEGSIPTALTKQNNKLRRNLHLIAKSFLDSGEGKGKYFPERLVERRGMLCA